MRPLGDPSGGGRRDHPRVLRLDHPRVLRLHRLDLLRFLDHPELRLDNNLAEGDLHMVALIRKNSLYLGAASAGPRFASCLSTNGV